MSQSFRLTFLDPGFYSICVVALILPWSQTTLFQLARLPIAFFDTRQLGDLIQRLHDFKRIESWLTNNVMTMLFAGVNLIIFGLVLTLFSSKLFVIFLLGKPLIHWVDYGLYEA